LGGGVETSLRLKAKKKPNLRQTGKTALKNARGEPLVVQKKKISIKREYRWRELNQKKGVTRVSRFQGKKSEEGNRRILGPQNKKEGASRRGGTTGWRKDGPGKEKSGGRVVKKKNGEALSIGRKGKGEKKKKSNLAIAGCHLKKWGRGNPSTEFTPFGGRGEALPL